MLAPLSTQGEKYLRNSVVSNFEKEGVVNKELGMKESTDESRVDIFVYEGSFNSCSPVCLSHWLGGETCENFVD